MYLYLAFPSILSQHFCGVPSCFRVGNEGKNEGKWIGLRGRLDFTDLDLGYTGSFTLY